ncbi:MAG: 5'-methylthioadenosine/S-adenosylhomocysteine nucleosidase [Chloroflexota bacterium]
MKTLIMIPLQKELDAFVQGCQSHQVQISNGAIGRLQATHLPDLDITLACGGLGKAQFGVQTQHLIDIGPAWDMVLCAGAAGGMNDMVKVGDVVIGVETVEHDINNRFGPPRLPKFAADQTMLDSFKKVTLPEANFSIHYGSIASGDEDIVDLDRRAALVQLTQSIACAWEGAGGARACQFSQIPFMEIRGITDGADNTAAADFKTNLGFAMHNLALTIINWSRQASS